MNSNTYFPTLALVGNPNCGKTALFNALTGAHQKVANYPGVTIDQKSGLFVTSSGQKVELLDLPGTYSLRARSSDEAITRDIILGHLAKTQKSPDLLLCIADMTNLHLGLRLVLELKKLNKPLLLVLNMADIAEKRGYCIDLKKLSECLGNIPVIPTVAISKTGIKSLLSEIDVKIQEIITSKHSSRMISQKTEQCVEWTEPSVQDIRNYHKEIEKILKVSNRVQGRTSIWTQRFDKVFLHPFLGLFALFLILFVMFQAVFSWAKIPQDAIQSLISFAQTFLISHMPDGSFRSLLVDGILSGVGSVLVFIPQILALFFFILILEDTGYMARAAFLMDRIMGTVGLNGKAFIPLLSSHACAIPGIMATRTIENKKDRLITILIAPLMTCSARLPVYTLIIAAFIPSKTIFGIFNLQGLILFCLYFLGITSGLLMALVFKIILKDRQKPFLLLELPCYRMPNLRNLALGLWERAKVFVQRAGTIILALMIIVWFLCSYPTMNSAPFNPLDTPIQHSFAGMLGKAITPLLEPIGFNWQIAIALIVGFTAREVAIATLGTIYALSASSDELVTNLSQILVNAWTLPTALAFLAWYVFAPQCAATLVVTKRETNSLMWPMVMFGYMLTLAYCFSWFVYHVATYAMSGTIS
jgi:ferrous iron transport protein B